MALASFTWLMPMVDAEDTRLDRHSLQAAYQPARGDGGHLRRGFGGIGKLTRRYVA